VARRARRIDGVITRVAISTAAFMSFPDGRTDHVREF
jgi:hypothetical protein